MVLCVPRRHWHILAPSPLPTEVQLPLLKLSSMVTLPTQSRNLTFDAECESRVVVAMCGRGLSHTLLYSSCSS